MSIHFCGDDNTAELILCAIISVNQLSIYGAVVDVCDELACRISGCSERTGKPVAQNNSETMVMPTESSTTNKTLRSNDNVQGHLLHNYEQKIENLPGRPRTQRHTTVFHIGGTGCFGQSFSIVRQGSQFSCEGFT